MYLPELVSPRSPLESLRVAAPSSNGGPTGPAIRFARIWPLMGARTMHMVLEVPRTVHHLVILPVYHNRLATITSHRGLLLMGAWSYPNQPSHSSSHKQFPTYSANCRVPLFGLGPSVNGILAQWTYCNEFVESESKSYALMSLITVNMGVRDDWIGTRNTKLEGLMIRGDELTVRGCEFLSGSIEQSAKGDLRPPPLLRVFSYII